MPPINLAYSAQVNKGGYFWEEFPLSVHEIFINECDRRVLRPPWNPRGAETPCLVLKDIPVGHKDGSELGPRRPVQLTERDSTLFLNFTKTGTTPEAIVRFANAYGQLYGVDFTTFNDWEYEILTMRSSVSLWHRVSHGEDDPSFTEWLTTATNNRGQSHYVPHEQTKTLLDYCSATSANWYTRTEFRHTGTGILDAARDYLANIISNRLDVLGAFSRLKYRRRDDAEPVLVVEPNSLIGLLWIQFALAVEFAFAFRDCETCGRSFELSPDAGRSDRQYCSDACRVKAYRGRQRRARVLHDQGKSPKQIAASVGSDILTVKKWINDQPKPKGDK